MSWREIYLGDGIHIKHGFAFKGEYFSSTGEYMVLTPGNFLEQGGFRVRDGKERFYHADFPEDYLLAEGDLIVAMTEQGEGLLGSAARIPGEGKFLHNQRLGLVQVVEPTLLDKRFLYWVFNSENVRAQIRATATGAKVKHTAPERIKKVRLLVPELPSQQAIAFLLDSYDDLIATNQRRIQLLEESARLLYREWFVHLRFPGHESVPVRDGVPEGWSEDVLGEVVEFQKGKKPSQVFPSQTDTSVPHLLVEALRIGDATEFAHPEGLVIASESDSIMVMDGSSSGETFIGRSGAIGSTLGRYRIKHESPHSPYWLYLTFKERLTELKGGNIGAAIPHANKEHIKQLGVLSPPESICREFDDFTRPIYKQVAELRALCASTAKARDLLLPKLMSGQLDVSRIPLPDEVAA